MTEKDHPLHRQGDRERIARLARNLLQALDWLRRQPSAAGLTVGVFGSNCGAAAAIVCAAERRSEIKAIVSRAAPLELVREEIARMQTPIMLVVGALDANVLHTTREVYRALRSDKRLEVVPRATHLFEEAGALEHVALVAAEWFLGKLAA